jgi:hypothetical protein
VIAANCIANRENLDSGAENPAPPGDMPADQWAASRGYGLASNTRLKGVAAAVRKRVKPPLWATSAMAAGPA